MNRYVLIWQVNDYPENGGGLQWRSFQTVEEMDAKVDQLLSEHGDKFKIDASYSILEEIKYQPVAVITKLARPDA